MVIPLPFWTFEKGFLGVSYLALAVLTSVSAPASASFPPYTFLLLDMVATMKEMKRIAAGTS